MPACTGCCSPRRSEDRQPGSLVAFTSAKPGSGASTLAAQTAFALRRTTSQRVLLADFDLMGGIIGFYLKLTNTKSLLDALQIADQPIDDAVAVFGGYFRRRRHSARSGNALCRARWTAPACTPCWNTRA